MTLMTVPREAAHPGAHPVQRGELERARRIVAGDVVALEELVDELHPVLQRIARQHVRDDTLAEEVVQDTWMAVLAGLPAFEGRASLKTWVLRVMRFRAVSNLRREQRTVPLSSFRTPIHCGEDVPPEPELPGHRYWMQPQRDWRDDGAESRTERSRALALVFAELERLPRRQREVVRLRDVEGWSASEVCDELGLSEANQRVLLHRGRGRLRDALSSRTGWGTAQACAAAS